MPAAKKPRTKRAKRAPPDPLAGALALASWSEADRNLARALVYADALAAALGAAPESVVDAMRMLSQSLGAAARKRGLARFGAMGARVPFDPALHELSRPMGRAPARVRVTAPGIARDGEILVKALVAPVRERP